MTTLNLTREDEAQVPADELRTCEEIDDSRTGEEGPKGDSELHVLAVGDHQNDADYRTQHGCREQDEYHRAPAEEGAEHRRQLNISAAQALLLLEFLVEEGDDKKKSAAYQCADGGIDGCRQQISLAHMEHVHAKADRDAGQRDRIGDDAMFEIDERHHDERRDQKHVVREIQLYVLKIPPAYERKNRGDQLNYKILRRDPALALTAFAEEYDVTQERNIFPPAKSMVASTAV